MRTLSLLGAAALYFTAATSSSVSFSPSAAKGITYSVSIPASTTSAGSGPIYFQLAGPTTYQWFALGIGGQMAGSTIFVMYADGKGNVTISPRSGQGEFMPLFNSAASVTLLAGSGVVGGQMIANVRYIAASGLVNGNSKSANWIASWRLGSPLNDPSQSANLIQHDAHSQFTFDLTQASIASDSNPFVATGSSSTSASASGGASATGAGTATGTGAAATPSASSGGSSSGSSEIGSGNGSSTTVLMMSHGIIMAAVMVVLYPLGGLVMRLGWGLYFHSAVQLLSLAAMLAGFGLGIKLAQVTNYLYNTTHTILGTVVIAYFIIQPFLGYFHHQRYKKIKRRTGFGYIHAYVGRSMIVVGIINGGLGLQLAANTVNGEIAYGVVAGVVFTIYVSIMLVTGWRRRQRAKNELSG